MKKHYTTKEKLLEICKECAKEKGINGFGMRDVANSSGFALSTVYNFFIDKETMIIKILVSIIFLPSLNRFLYRLSFSNNKYCG